MKALSFRRPASDLDVHRHTLETDFREHPPSSAQHAMDTIETLTGVDLATSLGIELLYLPAYFPNLNLIERLWKFVKKKCLYAIYYKDFTIFKQALSTCLGQTHTTHKKALDSLLTLRFQTFKHSQFVSL